MLDLKDRYSFWYKLLTLMLNGVHDEVPEIRKLCVEKFHAGGRQWEKENEEEIKDLVDFGLPEDSDRPPLGCCRVLVEREFSKIPDLRLDDRDPAPICRPAEDAARVLRGQVRPTLSLFSPFVHSQDVTFFLSALVHSLLSAVWPPAYPSPPAHRRRSMLRFVGPRCTSRRPWSAC